MELPDLMETSNRYRNVQIIVEVLSISLQLVAIVSPGWVGELHPSRTFYSSLFYGVVCELECKIQSHHSTYLAARRDNLTDAAVADVWYFRVVMVQVAAIIALVLSLLELILGLSKKIQRNTFCFTGTRPVILAVISVFELTVIASMWIGYDFNTRLSFQNIFPYSLITYAVSLVLAVFLTIYFTRLLVMALKSAGGNTNGHV